MTGSKPLSLDEKAWAFRRATSGFPKRYADQIQRGMSDAELTSALKDCLGIFGGSGGPDCIDVSFQGSSLKIWASHEIHNHVTAKPIVEGTATVKMARAVYSIADPTDAQMPLL